MQVRIGVAHAVELVAAQFATHAQLGAVEILEAEAVLALPVGVEAQHDSQRPPGGLRVQVPAQVGAAEIAVEVDHAAAAERRCLRRDRHRQVLHDAPLAGVHLQAQARCGRKLVFPHQPELLVAHRLARVEGERGRRRLARVLGHLRGVEPEWIFRLRRIQAVRD